MFNNYFCLYTSPVCSNKTFFIVYGIKNHINKNGSAKLSKDMYPRHITLG